MLKTRNTLWLNMTLAAGLVAALVPGGHIGTAVAQKSGVSAPQDNVAMGEDEVKRLLTLMDADKNGKVSKKEFMAFMEAEFKRLDKDNNGYLDQKELSQSALRVNPPASAVGK
jgi:hypothetical protein